MNRLMAVSFALAGFTLASLPAAAVQPGSLDLQLAVPDVSSVGFDPADLEALLCGGSEARGGGADDCRLVVKNDGSTGRLPDGADLVFSVQPSDLVSRCYQTVELVASELFLQSEGEAPLVTSCGAWDYTVELDPGAVQSVSTLSLLPQGGDHGVFVGTFELGVEITFSGAQTVVATRHLSLDVSGRWTTAGPLPTDGSSDLVLFAEPASSQWQERPDAARDATDCTHLVLRPTPGVLARLNAPLGDER
jgi:hypothetical protein